MKALYGLYEFLKIALIAVIIVVPLRFYVAQPFFVKGSSMLPTFSNGDYLVVDEISYRFKQPERGDVIVFRYPLDTSEFFIKRIIGLPGETLTSDGKGNLVAETLDGRRVSLDEPYLRGVVTSAFHIKAGPQDYIVLGDNRNASSDSRVWGTLPRADIIGRVLVTVWPPKDFAWAQTPAYRN